MLTITIEAVEQFDEDRQEFIYSKEQTLKLEHSLVSISKWESKWNKPFLTTDKTIPETIDYVRCMTITQNVDPNIYKFLSNKNISDVQNYIDEPMTATTITHHGGPPNREVITSEIIYYLMIAYNIPFECQKWHFNRLMMLINVLRLKNDQPKKMSSGAILNQNRALNEARRKRFNTRG